MIVPRTLDKWTLAEVRRVADSGISENDTFDLKADLQPAEHQRKTVAAFANSEGGFLVFGVANERTVLGVSNVELPRDFGTRLVTGMEPSIDHQFGPPLRLESGKVVYVCEVPKSKRGPHAVLANGAWVFLKRGPTGSNEPMTYSEIRAAFMEAGRRRSYLTLLKNELERIEEFGRMLNINAWHHPEMVLQTGGGALGPLQIETLLTEIFGDLAGDQNLVMCLNRVREHVEQINSTARDFSKRFSEDRVTPTDIDEYVGFLRNVPAQVSGEARHVLEAMKKAFAW